MHFDRRTLIKSAVAASAAAFAPSALAAGAAQDSAKKPFKLDYAPHFGMFREHGGGDIDGELAFMADQGFRSIEDNGTGISPEHMGAIFEPYRTTKSSGSGLGLLIVRRIIREHGGQIAIESQENQGTRVLIHLPHAERRVRLLGAPEADPVIDL